MNGGCGWTGTSPQPAATSRCGGARRPETVQRHLCRRPGGQRWREGQETRASLMPVPASHAWGLEPPDGSNGREVSGVLRFRPWLLLHPQPSLQWLRAAAGRTVRIRRRRGQLVLGAHHPGAGSQAPRKARAGPGMAPPACPGPVQSSGSWEETPRKTREATGLRRGGRCPSLGSGRSSCWSRSTGKCPSGSCRPVPQRPASAVWVSAEHGNSWNPTGVSSGHGSLPGALKSAVGGGARI